MLPTSSWTTHDCQEPSRQPSARTTSTLDGNPIFLPSIPCLSRWRQLLATTSLSTPQPLRAPIVFRKRHGWDTKTRQARFTGLRTSEKSEIRCDFETVSKQRE